MRDNDETPLFRIEKSNPAVGGGQCLVGSLVGVTATQIVTVAYKGQLILNGNQDLSCKGLSWLDSETY